jgi:hypothetical protein
MPLLELPLSNLRHHIFEKLSLDNRRPLMLVNSLSQVAHDLSTSVENRNRLLVSYQAAQLSSNALIPLLFGFPHGTNGHVINQEYPAFIYAIHQETNDKIFYSKVLCDDLFAH